MRSLVDKIFRPSLPSSLERWLTAEQGGDDDAAEVALATLFQALPRPVPSAGFAERVLAAAGVAAPVPLAWPLRLATAACLVLAGLGAASFLPAILGLLQLVAPGDVIAAGVDSFVLLMHRIDELAAVWRFVAQARQMVLVVATAPPVALSLLAASVAAATALYWMSEERFSARSQSHVEAH